nr:Glu-tRNA(Gln) amidotransferase subunit GatE [Candidatus Sigynarchaeota archaeon]
MSANDKLDYTSLGLMAGIEIHQQLKTKRKLFCRCPAEMTTRDPDFTINRNFRPVLGEMGVFDEAMLLEFEKKTKVIYEIYNDMNCTYELDDTPPFECDPESIDIAIELAKLLNMTIVDEFKVCRKNYLDGSVPGGFQRTMIAAKDGFYNLANGKKIGIEILCLEEDSARRIADGPGTITFRLDRLGIPLVEIATAPDIRDPEEAKEAAARLGLLLRATGKVRRGLGVTRQDLNVSIKEGARVEIKGVQKLDWIPLLIEREALRQSKLVELKKAMAKKKITKAVVDSIKTEGTDLSKELASTAVKFIASGIKKGDKLAGIKVPLMGGLLGLEVQPDRRFGTEISDRAKTLVGLSGIIHSDEKLDKYGFTADEITIIKKKLDVGTGDAFILILGSEGKLKRAFPVVKERIELALEGVPKETRRALENGNTDFLRGLHGGSRLYPDTDSRSILLEKARVDAIKVPPKPWDVIEAMSKKYGLDPKRVEQLILDGFLVLFNEIIEKMKVNPSIVLNTFLDTLTAIDRDGLDTDNINDMNFIDLFKALSKNEISKEAIDSILRAICKNPALTIAKAAKELNISAMSVDQLRAIIGKITQANKKMIEEKGDRAVQGLMGDVMKEVRGKIDGKIVSEELKKEVAKLVKK